MAGAEENVGVNGEKIIRRSYVTKQKSRSDVSPEKGGGRPKVPGN